VAGHTVALLSSLTHDLIWIQSPLLVMFAAKLRLGLPCGVVAIILLTYIATTTSIEGWISSAQPTRHPNALNHFLHPETIDALYEDTHLRLALLTLTETVATASSIYGKKFNSQGLSVFGHNLTERIAHIKATEGSKTRQKRGFLENLGNLFQGQTQDDGQQGQNQTEGGFLGQLGDLFSGGDGAGGLGDLLQQGLSGITDNLVGQLATPAYFLGTGLG
jgi:hypothetical protein